MGRLRVITLGLLGVLVLGGLAGGLALLTDPTGGRLGLTVDQLPGWLLIGNYTLPGIALIVLFGVLPLAAAVLLVRRRALGWTLTTAVGLLLVFWTAGQMVAIGLPAPRDPGRLPHRGHPAGRARCGRRGVGRRRPTALSRSPDPTQHRWN